jgi:hypothetical protein
MLTRVHRALVLYNAAVANASAGQNPVLVVGGQQMAAWIHSPQGRAVLALPGQDVVFVRGAITPNQVASHRPSYINAILPVLVALAVLAALAVLSVLAVLAVLAVLPVLVALAALAVLAVSCLSWPSWPSWPSCLSWSPWPPWPSTYLPMLCAMCLHVSCLRAYTCPCPAYISPLMRMRVGVDVTKKKKIIPTKTGCLLLSIRF